MKYVSTRGNSPAVGFEDALLTGLAPDGGLYLPEAWPLYAQRQLLEWQHLGYAELAKVILSPFIADDLGCAAFGPLVDRAYANFDHPAIAPLKQLDHDLWLMELFHGQTLAFKDYPLQLLGQLFDFVLEKRGETVTIVGATSGDTGAAAIEGVRDSKAADIFILYPEGRVSQVQRRQMTTVGAENVHCLAIDGTFDDCQDLVKALFADEAARAELNLSAVNSINWARIMAQIVYYFWAGLQLGAPQRVVNFTVPTGNFGNVFAGYAARKMGLPINWLGIGSNRNDILYRYLTLGDMSLQSVEPSLAPSMDIQVSSNFERLLFDLCQGDGQAVARIMTDFRKTGTMKLPRGAKAEVARLFTGFRYDDAEILAEISAVRAASSEILDPHTAIAFAQARIQGQEREHCNAPTVALATAHPAKFPDVVQQATGVRPDLPARLADLFDRPERQTRLPNDLAVVKAHIYGAARRTATDPRKACR